MLPGKWVEGIFPQFSKLEIEKFDEPVLAADINAFECLPGLDINFLRV